MFAYLMTVVPLSLLFVATAPALVAVASVFTSYLIGRGAAPYESHSLTAHYAHKGQTNRKGLDMEPSSEKTIREQVEELVLADYVVTQAFTATNSDWAADTILKVVTATLDYLNDTIGKNGYVLTDDYAENVEL